MENLDFAEMQPSPKSSPKNLGTDELLLIFSYYWITSNDLLNFRLVNKIWRDAATLILLKRDACYVNLQLISTKVLCDAKMPPYFVKFNSYNQNQPTNNTLTELTDLISNSSKFPASSFTIHTNASKQDFGDYANFTDLKLFFELHGTKIRTLSHDGYVTEKLIRDICFTYAPEIECLDLRQAVAIIKHSNQDDDKGRILPFQCLIIGNSAARLSIEYKLLIKFLLSFPSRLICIAEVPLNTVSNILDEGKGDLIRSIDFRSVAADEVNDNFLLLMETFLEVSPILYKISLEVSKFPWNEMNLNPINKLLKSSQHTLRELKLYFCRSEGVAKLEVPQMGNLQTITLRGSPLHVPDPDEPFNLFEYNHGILGRDYFPRLKTVKMQTRNVRIGSLASFFSLQQSENSFPQVDVLDIFTMSAFFILNITTLPQIFPRVRSLTLNWDKNIENMSGTLWLLKSLEFIEFYEIFTSQETGAGFDFVVFVDHFFTGFSFSLCKKLQTKILPRQLDAPGKWKFLQREESICNLQNLKQLKLKFAPGFSDRFASHVTGLYAFSQMRDTNFIISYNPNTINKIVRDQEEESDGDERNKYEKMRFGAIQPYVKVIQEA